MQKCPFCTVVQIDTIAAKAGFTLTNAERRQLIAALLSRQHIILSGPPNIGKRKLARELALAVTNNQEQRILTVQGHPWWAARTGNVARFVEIQSQFSIARISYFLDDILRDKDKTPEKGADIASHFAACIESMSPVEINFYFKNTAQWLNYQKLTQKIVIPLHLIGTYDTLAGPTPDETVLQYAAIIHFTSNIVLTENKEPAG